VHARDKKAIMWHSKKNIAGKELMHMDILCAGINNIDYLIGLERLTKLQLDNNNITKIENLNHLVTLKELGKQFSYLRL